MKSTLVVLAWTIVVALTIFKASEAYFNYEESRLAPYVERCEEDMPCWDCETMGNYVCGPVGKDK